MSPRKLTAAAAPPPATTLSAKKQTTGKRGGKRSTSWKPGQSGNPKGSPKRGESWAEIIKRYGEMTPSEAATHSLELVKKLLTIGDGVTLKQAVILRVYASLLFEPQPGLLNSFMDRADGKLAQTISVKDWREEAKERGIDPDKLVEFVDEQYPDDPSDPAA